MAGLDTNGTVTVLKYSLAKAQDLFTQYQQLRGSQGGSINNTTILKTKKVDLQNQLTELTAEVDTLNTEFNDRSAAKKPSKLENLGLKTKQDWILFIFFASYGIACLVILAFTVVYSQKKITGAGMVILCSFVIGIMMGRVLKYYA
jgi:hypothetical protein